MEDKCRVHAGLLDPDGSVFLPDLFPSGNSLPVAEAISLWPFKKPEIVHFCTNGPMKFYGIVSFFLRYCNAYCRRLWIILAR